MKNLLSALTLSAAFTLAGGLMSPAFAGEACCPLSKSAAKEGAAACTKGDKAACKEECKDKASCTDAEKAACEAACKSSCKGGDASKGSDEDMVKAGYGIGERVPDFSLTDTAGNTHTLSQHKGNPVVLIFWNQNCPYVVEVKDRVNAYAKEQAGNGVVVLGIDPGVNNAAESIAEYAKGLSFPMLVDNTSDSARNFGATRTPEVFVLNRDGVVVYHGAFDNGAAGSEEGARRSYAADAVAAVLKNEEVMVNKTKAFGCTIKFNEKHAASMKPGSDNWKVKE